MAQVGKSDNAKIRQEQDVLPQTDDFELDFDVVSLWNETKYNSSGNSDLSVLGFPSIKLNLGQVSAEQSMDLGYQFVSTNRTLDFTPVPLKEPQKPEPEISPLHRDEVESAQVAAFAELALGGSRSAELLLADLAGTLPVGGSPLHQVIASAAGDPQLKSQIKSALLESFARDDQAILFNKLTELAKSNRTFGAQIKDIAMASLKEQTHLSTEQASQSLQDQAVFLLLARPEILNRGDMSVLCASLSPTTFNDFLASVPHLRKDVSDRLLLECMYLANNPAAHGSAKALSALIIDALSSPGILTTEMRGPVAMPPMMAPELAGQDSFLPGAFFKPEQRGLPAPFSLPSARSLPVGPARPEVLFGKPPVSDRLMQLSLSSPQSAGSQMVFDTAFQGKSRLSKSHMLTDASYLARVLSTDQPAPRRQASEILSDWGADSELIAEAKESGVLSRFDGETLSAVAQRMSIYNALPPAVRDELTGISQRIDSKLVAGRVLNGTLGAHKNDPLSFLLPWPEETPFEDRVSHMIDAKSKELELVEALGLARRTEDKKEALVRYTEQGVSYFRRAGDFLRAINPLGGGDSWKDEQSKLFTDWKESKYGSEFGLQLYERTRERRNDLIFAKDCARYQEFLRQGDRQFTDYFAMTMVTKYGVDAVKQRAPEIYEELTKTGGGMERLHQAGLVSSPDLHEYPMLTVEEAERRLQVRLKRLGLSNPDPDDPELHMELEARLFQKAIESPAGQVLMSLLPASVKETILGSRDETSSVRWSRLKAEAGRLGIPTDIIDVVDKIFRAQAVDAAQSYHRAQLEEHVYRPEYASVLNQMKKLSDRPGAVEYLDTAQTRCNLFRGLDADPLSQKGIKAIAEVAHKLATIQELVTAAQDGAAFDTYVDGVKEMAGELERSLALLDPEVQDGLKARIQEIDKVAPGVKDQETRQLLEQRREALSGILALSQSDGIRQLIQHVKSRGFHANDLESWFRDNAATIAITVAAVGLLAASGGTAAPISSILLISAASLATRQVSSEALYLINHCIGDTGIGGWYDRSYAGAFLSKHLDEIASLPEADSVGQAGGQVARLASDYVKEVALPIAVEYATTVALQLIGLKIVSGARAICPQGLKWFATSPVAKSAMSAAKTNEGARVILSALAKDFPKQFADEIGEEAFGNAVDQMIRDLSGVAGGWGELPTTVIGGLLRARTPGTAGVNIDPRSIPVDLASVDIETTIDTLKKSGFIVSEDAGMFKVVDPANSRHKMYLRPLADADGAEASDLSPEESTASRNAQPVSISFDKASCSLTAPGLELTIAGEKVTLQSGESIQLARENFGDEYSNRHISRTPITLGMEGESPYVIDMGDRRYGTSTYVNGHRVYPGQKRYFQPGDTITFGGRETPAVTTRERALMAPPSDYETSPEALTQSQMFAAYPHTFEPLHYGFTEAGPFATFDKGANPVIAKRHATVVDPRIDVVLAATIEEAKVFCRTADGKELPPRERAERLNVFVKQLLEPDSTIEAMQTNWYHRFCDQNIGEKVLLGDFIRRGKGVCMEQALLMKSLGDHLGLNVTLVCGSSSVPHYIDHAWTEVDLGDGTPLIFDPRQQIAGGRYSDFVGRLRGIETVRLRIMSQADREFAQFEGNAHPEAEGDTIVVDEPLPSAPPSSRFRFAQEAPLQPSQNTYAVGEYSIRTGGNVSIEVAVTGGAAPADVVDDVLKEAASHGAHPRRIEFAHTDSDMFSAQYIRDTDTIIIYTGNGGRPDGSTYLHELGHHIDYRHIAETADRQEFFDAYKQGLTSETTRQFIQHRLQEAKQLQDSQQVQRIVDYLKESENWDAGMGGAGIGEVLYYANVRETHAEALLLASRALEMRRASGTMPTFEQVLDHVAQSRGDNADLRRRYMENFRALYEQSVSYLVENPELLATP